MNFVILSLNRLIIKSNFLHIIFINLEGLKKKFGTRLVLLRQTLIFVTLPAKRDVIVKMGFSICAEVSSNM